MGHAVFLGLTVFIACLVEMIEALTIVLALGLTRGWKSVLLATGAAILTLAAVIAVFGASLMRISDESSPNLQRLWLILGALLLIFGIQWMKKAILRFASLLPSRDEDVEFNKVSSAAAKARFMKGEPIDWYAFVAAYKGVLLEGLEVIFIIITFGVSQHDLHLGIISALAALAVIVALGLIAHRPLAHVPENAMKLVVGILLTTFGTYYAVKGLGVYWPHGDAAVWGILLFYVLLSLFFIDRLSRNAAFKRVVRR